MTCNADIEEFEIRCPRLFLTTVLIGYSWVMFSWLCEIHL